MFRSFSMFVTLQRGMDVRTRKPKTLSGVAAMWWRVYVTTENRHNQAAASCLPGPAWTQIGQIGTSGWLWIKSQLWLGVNVFFLNPLCVEGKMVEKKCLDRVGQMWMYTLNLKRNHSEEDELYWPHRQEAYYTLTPLRVLLFCSVLAYFLIGSILRVCVLFVQNVTLFCILLLVQVSLEKCRGWDCPGWKKVQYF